eukprot:SAG31_NODE_3686_length_3988_cov_1.963487_3_plen_87_part_00
MFYDPDEYAHYEDMTEEKLHVLEPPNARYGGRPRAKSLMGRSKQGLHRERRRGERVHVLGGGGSFNWSHSTSCAAVEVHSEANLFF